MLTNRAMTRARALGAIAAGALALGACAADGVSSPTARPAFSSEDSVPRLNEFDRDFGRASAPRRTPNASHHTHP
jgi:hypothetical protein